MSSKKVTLKNGDQAVIATSNLTDAQTKTLKKRWVALSKGRTKRIPILNSKLTFRAFGGEKVNA